MTKAKIKNKPVRSAEVPATSGMLYEMEDRLCHRIDNVKSEFRSEIHEVKSEIDGLKSELHGMKSETHGIKSEIHGIKGEIHGIKGEIHGIKSEIHGIKGEIHGVKSELHRVALLVEEQRAQNKYVLDGYTQLYDKIGEMDGKFDELKQLIIQKLA